MWKIKYTILFLFLFFSCSDNEKTHSYFYKNEQISGEYIYRKSNEKLLNIEAKENELPIYPWQERSNRLPFITKEFFRCKGNELNEIKISLINGQEKKYRDCGGFASHGLPLKNGKEFIYPILMDLLNYIQKRTQEKVIITSGHRCPEHNLYVDPECVDLFSKHMIGAEVSFYVLNHEHNPLKIISYIQEYYDDNEENNAYLPFERYEKNDIKLKFKPIFNKEIFIKLYESDEGRNFDNSHSYPYISIQVRYDRNLKEKVTYTWQKAHREYLKK